MNKLSEFFKGLVEKFKNLSGKKRIAIISLAVLVLAVVIFLGVYLGSTKYELLFANMDAKDAKKVTDKLTEEKVTYHIDGSSIYVPKGQGDALRMDILGSVEFNGGTQGWELFDSTNQFGPTDLENQVKYTRALEGELEKTIKAFPQVSSDIVNLVLSEDSAFVKDSTKASASVFLKLKPNQKLKKDQVKAIVMLVSGSVKNLPKENIQVVDDNMNLLSQGLFSSDSSQQDASSVTNDDNTSEQEQMKKDYEKYCEDKALDMLKLVYGDKVNVKVNVDLNFDAISQQTTTYNPTGTVVSENSTSSTDGNPSGTANTNSPVDNNMVNSGTTTTTTNNSSTSTNVTKNYEISSDVKKIIYAPGSVKRITAAVIIGGNVDDNTKTAVTNTVQTALGIDTNRGDVVSVEGLPFDTTLQQQQKTALKQMNDEIQQENKMKQVFLFVGLGALGAIALVAVIVMLIKRRSKKNTEEEEILEEEKGNGIDVVVGENIVPQEIETAEEKKPKTNFKPLNLEPEENEQSHIENEVKKYAMDKPEQVADIIKSWLADDER